MKLNLSQAEKIMSQAFSFLPILRYFTNNFESNKDTLSKVGDFS